MSASAAELLREAMQHHQAGRLGEAEPLYRRVLAQEPRNANALYLLGVLATQQGRSAEAAAWLERSLGITGPQPLLLNELGKAYFALARLAQARERFAQAAALQPDLAEAHGNLGAVLAALGERREALQSLRRAAALQPHYPNAHFNLGRTLQELGLAAEAERSYREALALDPRMADAHYNLGNLLTTAGRLEEAEAHYRTALDLGSSTADLHFSFGNVLHVLGNFEEAEQAFRKTPEHDPRYAEARWALAVSRLRTLDASPGEASPEAAKAELQAAARWLESNPIKEPARVVAAVQPFYLAYHEKNHRDLLAEYGRQCARMMAQWWDRQGLRAPARVRRDKLQLGIVSAHIHDHSTWHAIVEGWVRHLDRERIELSIFYLGQGHDPETGFAAAHAAHFERDFGDLRRSVDAILRRQPDALIFPAVGQDPDEARLAALRLAPLQLAAWSHPETSGFPTMDVYLSAQAFEPEGAQEHYTERLLALPNLGCCYSALRPPAAEPDLAAHGIDGDRPILLCTGSPFKYAPEHDRLLVEIARRAKDARLVFFELDPKPLAERLRERLRSAFAAAGMDFDRHVAFVPRLPRPQFFGLMRRSHLWLDTLGYSGFNTAMQAVECGLPIVAREGRFMRGRFASGILRRMGMHEWVAGSDEQYVELAASLANDAARTREARLRIEASRDALFDDPAPVRALEDFLLGAAPA